MIAGYNFLLCISFTHNYLDPVSVRRVAGEEAAARDIAFAFTLLVFPHGHNKISNGLELLAVGRAGHCS